MQFRSRTRAAIPFTGSACISSNRRIAVGCSNIYLRQSAKEHDQRAGKTLRPEYTARSDSTPFPDVSWGTLELREDLPTMIRMPHRSTMILLLGVFFAIGCGGPPDMVDAPLERESPQSTEVPRRADGAIIGVEVYESEREFPGLFEEWRALGVTAVFAGEELTSSGGFRALARKNDTDLFIIFPVFVVPEALAENPDLRAIPADGEGAQKGRVEFVCPSRRDFRDRRVEDARMIVKRLRPEGLSIDVLSQYVFWEAAESERGPATPPDTCYCVHCLQAFATFLGVPVFSIPPQPQRAAAWIEARPGLQMGLGGRPELE